MFRLLLSATALGSLMLLVSCTEINEPYGSSPHYDSYDRPYYEDYHDHDWRDREREREWEEQKRIEHERERLDRERRHLDEERREEDHRRHEEPARPTPRPQPKVESCPSGYTPSERKCTPDERKRGCKDVRLDSGLGCVKR